MSDYSKVQLDATAFVSPLASACGDVRIGPQVTLFAGAQLRGDDGQYIEIGEDTNVQENVVVHVGRKHPTIVGKRVTVGHGAIVHGCTVEDDVLLGMGSIVMDGALIRRGSVVGAGALITGGKEFPERSLIVGSPAKAVRELSEREVEVLITSAAEDYVEVGVKMAAEGYMLQGEAARAVLCAPHCATAGEAFAARMAGAAEGLTVSCGAEGATEAEDAVEAEDAAEAEGADGAEAADRAKAADGAEAADRAKAAVASDYLPE